jgi:hypothetical protein
VTGILALIVGKSLNKLERIYIDKETGKEVVWGLFFIPTEYWGVTLIIIGIVSFINSNTTEFNTFK